MRTALYFTATVTIVEATQTMNNNIHNKMIMSLSEFDDLNDLHDSEQRHRPVQRHRVVGKKNSHKNLTARMNLKSMLKEPETPEDTPFTKTLRYAPVEKIA